MVGVNPRRCTEGSWHLIRLLAALTFLCKARTEVHSLQACRHRAYMEAQTVQRALWSKAYMEVQLVFDVRAPIQEVLLEALAESRAICFRWSPIV